MAISSPWPIARKVDNSSGPRIAGMPISMNDLAPDRGGGTDQEAIRQRQAGAAHRASVYANRSFAHRWQGKALRVDRGQRIADCRDEAGADRHRHPAIDDR